MGQDPGFEGTRLERVARAVVPALLAHRRKVLGLALLLAAIGAFFSARLYGDLRSGVEELLPASAPSVVAAKTVLPRLHNTTRLAVELVGSDGDALEHFADDLAARLRALPGGMVEAVDYRTDVESSFLRRFGLLYLTTEDLRTVADRIEARVRWEKQHAISLLPEEDGPPPSVDFADIEARYADRLAAAPRFRNGYTQTPDGKVLVMMVRPPEQSTGLEVNQALLEAVKREVAALGPAHYDPQLRVGYSGEVAEVVEEQHALVSDLASSTVLVLVFVTLALWLYFRRWAAIGAVLGPLAIGCALTFGLGDALIGHLNANTAFLGSIVVGNGINVGIIYVARYLELRRAGTAIELALQQAWSSTLPSTFVASFGAGLAYLSLGSTDFRGFSQFGLLGGLGMALCWVCAYLLLPPLLAEIERHRPIQAAAPRGATALGRLTDAVTRYPRVFRVASVLLLAGCAAAVAGYQGDVVEYDFSKMRSRHSLKSGAAFWGKYQDEVFNKYLTPVVLWGETPGDLQRALAALSKRRAALGEDDPIREVQSLATAIPSDQPAKLALLARIRGLLTDARLAQLAPDLRAKVEKLRPPADLKAMTVADLPEAWRRVLVEKDGTTGRVALAFPRKVGALDMHEAGDLKDLLRGAVADANAKVEVANPILLLSDVDEAIWRDGPKATLIAFAMVCLLVLFTLRELRSSAAVIGALLLGLAGLVGLAAAANVRLNFLNFVVLPITFGIGVDYAVNIVQRVRRDGVGSLNRVLRETGSAVALCSATTCIGYGSLIFADSQALSGFGLLATLGEVTCLAAALFLLPAWLVRREPKPVEEPAPAIAA